MLSAREGAKGSCFSGFNRRRSEKCEASKDAIKNTFSYRVNCPTACLLILYHLIEAEKTVFVSTYHNNHRLFLLLISLKAH